MVLSPSKSAMTVSRFARCSSMEGCCTCAQLGFGPWHYAPICVFSICVFWMTSWYQSHIVRLATTFLPIHEFGRHLANTGVAVLLCPLQLIATFAALRHAYPADTEHPSIEKKSEDDASTDRGSSPPRSTRTRLLYLLKDLVAFYSLLAPTNLPWAVTAESSKAGARMLSRYLSITEYAASGNSQVLYRLLNADTILIARRAACVLALFVFLWMALVLPATIGMRRMHAPLVILVLPDTLQSVPIDDCIWTKNWRQGKLTVSFSRAWHSLAWQQYRRLLAIYAASFFVLTFVAVAGISHFTVALGNPAWRPY